MQQTADKRMNLFTCIAAAVKAKLPSKEEHRRGYAPVAWSNEQLQTMEARDQLLQVLNGRQPLSMIAGVYTLPPADGAPATDANNASDVSGNPTVDG